MTERKRRPLNFNVKLWKLTPHHYLNCFQHQPHLHGGTFKESLEKVTLILNEYAAFLRKSNEEQQRRQFMMHPVREVCKDAFMNHVEPTENISNKYSILDCELSKLDKYQYLYFDEELHIREKFRSNFERYDFINNIQLSFPINMLR